MRCAAAAATVDFERLWVDGAAYTLNPESYYRGYDSLPYPEDNVPEMHPYVSNGVEFFNEYGVTCDQYGWVTSWWDGWGVSNMTDTTTPGFGNQMSAITGSGLCGSANYGVAYLPDYSWCQSNPANEVFRRAPVEAVHTDIAGRYGLHITNTTYGYLSMRDGDGFARAFSADTNDYLRLTITGLDENGEAIEGLAPVDFYLADFREEREPGAVQGNYIVDSWTWVDMASLVAGGADQLQFLFSSSDVDPTWGINTPLFFAMDNIPSIPGDASLDGMVDDVDAMILAANWGKQGDTHWVEGDFNSDGKVGAADAAFLAANWGRSIQTTGETAKVPEPGGTMILVVMGLAGLATGRSRRRRGTR